MKLLRPYHSSFGDVFSNFTLPTSNFLERPKTLPTVLSQNEIERLFQCTTNLKHQTFLMTLYAAGLRLSEAANLKIPDIDSDRMMLRVAMGKGKKERLIPLSPRLLKQLRVYWKQYKPPTLLFPGKDPGKPIVDTSIRKPMKDAARRAGITKRVYPHVLRHSYATGLLEAGVDLLTISRLLGHASFTTTMKYLHCRRKHLYSTPSPLDWLPIRQLPTLSPPEDDPPKKDDSPNDPA